MNSAEPFKPTYPAPTPLRPLLGLTVLVIEDSRYACEALRLLSIRSGARIRRADTMRSARRHLQAYRPSVALIDLGLPDGSGLDLIRDLNRTAQRPDVMLAISGDPENAQAAKDAGADDFLEKPIVSLSAFQEAILTHLPDDRKPVGPRILPDGLVQPDPIAYRDDMVYVADVLEDPKDGRALDYVVQFLGGVARSAQDSELLAATDALAVKRAIGDAAVSETAVVAALVQDRLAEKVAI